MSRGFSKQENWIGLPFPSPEDLPDPGIKPTSFRSPALAGRFFTTTVAWESRLNCCLTIWHISFRLLFWVANCNLLECKDGMLFLGGGKQHHMICGILLSRPGIEPMPPAVGAQSLNHRIAREFPMTIYFAPVCRVLEVRSPTQCHWAHIKVLADGVLSGDPKRESLFKAHTPWCSAPCIHQPSDGWWSVSR